MIPLILSQLFICHYIQRCEKRITLPYLIDILVVGVLITTYKSSNIKFMYGLINLPGC